MIDPLKEKVTRWSLEQVRFLLAHVEEFIEDEKKDFRERALHFVAQSGLDKIESLNAGDPHGTQLPVHLLSGLSPFFDAGLLMQRGLSPENANWWVTDIFWRGSTFHLDLKDQVRATSLVPEITPLQVHKTATLKLLEKLDLPFLAPKFESHAYLFKPTPLVAYVLISSLADHWAGDHLSQAHRLINNSFIY